LTGVRRYRSSRRFFLATGNVRMAVAHRTIGSDRVISSSKANEKKTIIRCSGVVRGIYFCTLLAALAASLGRDEAVPTFPPEIRR
jgi:hypothetical protein